MFVSYAVLMFAAVHNTVRFGFGSNRYQNFHITYFYVLVYLVILFRVSWLSLILYVANNYRDYTEPNKDGGLHLIEDALSKAIYYLDVTVTYLELLIGI